MKTTPFMYLKENVDKIKFNCEDKYIKEYKRAFCAVLDRMDEHFIKNNLYDVVDYQPIVEKMLATNKNFVFNIYNELSTSMNASGVFFNSPKGVRVIGMAPEYMNKGTTTEGTLCHEFIHYLTLGPETLTYTKDGDKYETQLPQKSNGLRIGGIKRNLTKRDAMGLDAGDALDRGFICEGLTELFKQEIYSQEEAYHAYPAQTSLLKLLNDLTGTKVNTQDFLRGDLPNYVESLGRKNFDKFNDLCEKFQTKFSKNNSVDHTRDNDYLEALDMVCKTILSKIEENPENYSAKDYVRIVSSILYQTNTITENPNYSKRYQSAIVRAGNALTSNQKGTFEERQEYNRLLKKTIAKAIIRKSEAFDIPSPNLNFSFKQTHDGFALRFKDGSFISSFQFPKSHYSSCIAQTGKYRIKIELSDKGIYKISASGDNINTETINIISKDKKGSELLIQDSNNQSVFKLNFSNELKKLDRTISENLGLLDNFKNYQDLKDVLKYSKDINPYQVKKIKLNNGNEYLVANSNKSSAFYRITENGYRKVDVVKQYNTEKGVIIRNENNKNIETDEDILSFELKDGNIFVRYFDNEGMEQIGQKLSSSNFVAIDNETIYSKTNTDINDSNSFSNPFDSKMIERKLPYRNLEMEKKIEQRQRKLEEEKLLRREKKQDKLLEQQRQNQNLIKEEIDRRDKKIKEERLKNRQEEKEKEKKFVYVEEKTREKTVIYDEYGVDVTRIYETEKKHINQSMDRGR